MSPKSYKEKDSDVIVLSIQEDDSWTNGEDWCVKGRVSEVEEGEIERERFLNDSSRYEYCFWYSAKRIIGIRKEKTFLVLILNQ